MDDDWVERAAQVLRKARKGHEVRRIRLGLSDDDAMRVIHHSSLSDLDRLAIKLAQAYRCETGRGPGTYSDSEILWDYKDEDGS